MLKILLVEDEPLLAETLKSLIELNPCYRVTHIADDLESALAAVEEQRPDLALVDLQLARGCTGFSVAVRMNELQIPCLLSSSKAPDFPMRDLAIGCLAKPYREADLVKALETAEDVVRGRRKLVLRPSLPDVLKMYEAEQETVRSEPEPEDRAWIAKLKPGRPSLRSRLAHWLAA